MKLSQLLDLHFQEKPQLSPRTIKKYQSVVRMFIVDSGVDHIFITRDECIQWRNKILKRSSAGNCNNYHRHLKSLFNTAVYLKKIDNNVFKSIDMLKSNNEKCRILKNNTLKKLINCIDTDQYYSQLIWFYLAMIDIFRFTGIRRRQLIGIKWQDIDFNNQTLHLDAEFSKNGIANLIPINPIIIAHFRTIYRKSYKAEGSDQVFNITKFVKTYKDNTMTEDHVSSLFTKWSKKIGSPVSAHRFRHTVATKIANNGCNLKSLQQLLGHQDIKTTMGYVEVNIDDLRKIQDLL